jgi:hypothetical protein
LPRHGNARIRRHAGLGGQLVQQVTNQAGEVLPPVAQGRNGDRDVKPAGQIGDELVFNVAFGGTDDTHRDSRHGRGAVSPCHQDLAQPENAGETSLKPFRHFW